jgi:hypothetical protein
MRNGVERVARIAWAFVAMNAAVIAGLVRLVARREVWR